MLVNNSSSVHPSVLRFLGWLSSRALPQHSVTRSKNFLTRACPAPSTTRTRPTASSTRTCPTPARKVVWVPASALQMRVHATREGWSAPRRTTVYHDNFNNCWLVGTVLETLQYCEHYHAWLVRCTAPLVMSIKSIWFIHRYYVCSHHLGLLIFMCSHNLNWSIHKFHKSTVHVVQWFLKLSVEIKLLLQKFLKNYDLNWQWHSWCLGVKNMYHPTYHGATRKLTPNTLKLPQVGFLHLG